MSRIKTTSRGLTLLVAAGLAQGGTAFAQSDLFDPGLTAPPPVNVVPIQPNPLHGVPQEQPAQAPATQIAPRSDDPVYEAIPGVPTYRTPVSPTYQNNKQIPVYVPYSARSGVDPKDKTRGENLLEAYYAPKYPTTLPLYGTNGPSWGPGGHVASGMRVGQPYNWSRGYPGAQGPAGYAGYGYGYGYPTEYGYGAGYGAMGAAGPVYGPTMYGQGRAGCGCRGGASPGGYQPGYGPGYAMGYSGGGVGDVGASVNAAYGGGAMAFSGNPHEYHFGPGFHRHSDHAHYRFPWYSYRAPWYHPGPASYNRDTNYPW